MKDGFNSLVKPAFLSGFFLALAVVIAGCAPVPTLTNEDAKAFRFVETPSYDLALVASRPMESVQLTVTGYQLRILSPVCAVQVCVPDEQGFVRLTFPDEAGKNYGRRLEITVQGGLPVRGTARARLEGETLTRPATLKVQP